MTAWIDCTQTLSPDLLTWPGDPPFARRLVRCVADGDRTNTSELTTSAHIGTHIDAPNHLFTDAATIEAIPLDALCGRALVVRIDADRHVRPADLESQPIEPGDRLLLKTANQRRPYSAPFDAAFAALTTEAAHWLVERSVRLVGIDYLSVDPYDAEALPAHQVLLSAGTVVIEGLALSKVDAGRYELVALPLKLGGADGAPARVIVRPWDR